MNMHYSYFIMTMNVSLFGRRYKKESEFIVLVFLNVNNSSVIWIDSSKI